MAHVPSPAESQDPAPLQEPGNTPNPASDLASDPTPSPAPSPTSDLASDPDSALASDPAADLASDLAPDLGSEPAPDPAEAPAVTQALETLDAVQRDRYALKYAVVSTLWLAETADPPAACRGRGEALASLDAHANRLLCGPELGKALQVLEPCAESLDFSRAAQVRVAARDRAQQAPIPPALAERWVRQVNDATEAWHNAKTLDRWQDFAPHLDALVRLDKERCQRIDPDRDPYDVALSLNEQGTSRAFYDAFFAQVRDAVVPLVEQVRQRPQLSRDCVRGAFDLAGQWALTRDLAFSQGVDPAKLVLGETEHPFSDSIDSGHVFIATHLFEDDLLSGVFSLLHEGGHALYEAGVDPAYDFTCLAGGTSTGMHESQSRFFENLVGRSEAFAPRLLAALASHFPEPLAQVTPRQLYEACNVAEPSLIRTEADELTYPLHVLVRYEVEQALFAGTVDAAGVPELWARLYERYLGVTVPDDRRGALQDIHWSQGSFGYFPTYALGSAYASQLLAAMQRTVDVPAALASGDLAPIRAWLRDRVWRWGRSKDPAQIIQDACGEPFSPTYYTRYLAEKFGALYGIEQAS